MKEIVFFSNNKNKIKEVSNFFLKSQIKLLNLNDFEKINSPKEIGKTFEENAKIKSMFGLKHFNKICFADDSGICIETLKWGPGIKSKFYLESNKDSKAVLEKIISNAKDSKKFKAYFQTTICLSINKKSNFFFTGKISGKIATKILGDNGFGYDPIFIPSGQKITFAQMSLKEKNLLSHRALAMKKLIRYLKKLV